MLGQGVVLGSTVSEVINVVSWGHLSSQGSLPWMAQACMESMLSRLSFEIVIVNYKAAWIEPNGLVNQKKTINTKNGIAIISTLKSSIRGASTTTYPLQLVPCS